MRTPGTRSIAAEVLAQAGRAFAVGLAVSLVLAIATLVLASQSASPAATAAGERAARTSQP